MKLSLNRKISVAGREYRDVEISDYIPVATLLEIEAKNLSERERDIALIAAHTDIGFDGVMRLDYRDFPRLQEAVMEVMAAEKKIEEDDRGEQKDCPGDRLSS